MHLIIKYKSNSNTYKKKFKPGNAPNKTTNHKFQKKGQIQIGESESIPTVP